MQSLLYFFHNLEGSSNTAYFAIKEMESCDESYLTTESKGAPTDHEGDGEEDGETSMTHWTRLMLRLSDNLQARDATSRASCRQCEWQGMFCNIWERLVCSTTKQDPKTLYVYTDTDWAADELTRKSVSCTVERNGSYMLDFTVAKQSLVAPSSGEAEFYGIVRAVATSKQTSQILEQIGMQLEVTIASDSSAARRTCTRTGSGKVGHLSIKELWMQESYRKKEFQLVSVDTLLNWAEIGTKAHVWAPWRRCWGRCHYALEREQKQTLACPTLMDEEHFQPRSGWRRSRRMVRSRRVWWMPWWRRSRWRTPTRERRTLLVTRSDAVPHWVSIELFQQSRQLWNGLFASAIVTTTQCVDSSHSDLWTQCGVQLCLWCACVRGLAHWWISHDVANFGIWRCHVWSSDEWRKMNDWKLSAEWS